jgi:chromosome segregation ATPase
MKTLDLTYSAVAAVAESMEQQGLEPSVRTVRDQLGGGSNSKVLPMLRQWKEARAARVASNVQLNPGIVDLILAQIAETASLASNDANMRAADAEEAMGQLAAELEAMEGRLAEREQELNTAQTQVLRHQGQLHERARELEELRDLTAKAINEAEERAAADRGQVEALHRKLERDSIGLDRLEALEAELHQARQLIKDSADDVAMARQTAAVAEERTKAQSDRAHQAELREAKLETQLQGLQEQQAAALALERKLKDEIKTLSKASSSLQARCVVQQSEIARLRQAARKAEAKDDDRTPDRDGAEPATTPREPRGTV